MTMTGLRRICSRRILVGSGLFVLLGAGLAIAQQVGSPGAPAGLPAPATTDIQPTKSRLLKLDIDYKPEQRKLIDFVELVASRDQGQTWQVMDTVTPEKDFLKFEAKDDGLYFVSMVIVFKNGSRDPKDPSRTPAQLKLLVDTVAPVVKITNALPQMDEILVEWTIDEKHLDTIKTKLLYKSSSSTANDWLPVAESALAPRGAKFKPAIAGPLMVQLIVQDLAGNVTATAKEVPLGVTALYTPPATPALPIAAPTILPTNPSMVPAPDFSTAPVAPPPIAAPVNPSMAPPPISVPAPAPAGTGNWTNPNATPAAISEAPRSPVIGVGTAPGLPSVPPAAMSGFSPPPATTAAAPVPGTQFIRFTEFDLAYQMDAGPSGISRVDLYVTRDEGRTWQKWSTHGGKEVPLKVKLAMPFNAQKEGDYGLRLVPVSGAGLADDPPTAGTPPELRLHVDTVPPLLTILAPVAALNQPNGLTLQWQASDRNFGLEPILIEWCESNAGPWKPVANDETTPGTGRTANTGSFTWIVPKSLPTHRVFLRMTATDAAGNRSIAVTSQPISIDLTKPKARITTISTGEVTPRP